MPRLVKVSEATAARRRVYFQLVLSDGITPALAEAGGQPQISTNGGSWTNTGIGTLTAIGNGRYYADLTTGAVATAGDEIETRYKSLLTAECPGDSVQVVAFDPSDLFVAPGSAAGRQTRLDGMLRRLYERGAGGNESVRDRSTGTVQLLDTDDTTVLETHTQSTSGSVDTQSKGT